MGILGDVWDTGTSLLDRGLGILKDPSSLVDRGDEFRGVDPNNFGFGGQGFADNINRMGRRDSDALRQNQAGLIGLLEQQAQGQGPGQELAKLRAQEQANRGIRQQLSLAAGAGPGNEALASRQAAQNMGSISQGAAQTAAQGGLAAQLGATQQLGGVLQGARGQDQQSLQQAINANQMLEQQRANRFASIMGSEVPTANRALLNTIAGGAMAFGGM